MRGPCMMYNGKRVYNTFEVAFMAHKSLDEVWKDATSGTKRLRPVTTGMRDLWFTAENIVDYLVFDNIDYATNTKELKAHIKSCIFTVERYTGEKLR